ncbi:MAG: squalene/phytoene synthase family protein [Pseudomonadota bacterium]
MSATIDALAPAPMAPGQDPARIAAAITGAANTSFASGMAILSRPRREAMWALYAFARLIDDIADEDWPLADKHRLLDAWVAEIGALYQGRAVSAVGLALAGPIERYDLPQAEFLALIEGMRMDADGPLVAPPMVVLRAYTRRVAGAVGLLSMRIFGAWRGEVSERFALALADAFQFTNILRDVEEDAGLGRLYLPAELLERAGVPPDPGAALSNAGLAVVRAELGRLARAEFVQAGALIGAHERLRLAPALLMAGVYATYLARMEAAGFSLGAPIRLSKTEKLWRGLLCFAAPSGSALAAHG